MILLHEHVNLPYHPTDNKLLIKVELILTETRLVINVFYQSTEEWSSDTPLTPLHPLDHVLGICEE
jgi:hypothetical protein